MVRTRVKGNGMKAASSPSTEPDFYAMEPCYERSRSTSSVEGSYFPEDAMTGHEETPRENSSTREATADQVHVVPVSPLLEPRSRQMLSGPVVPMDLGPPRPTERLKQIDRIFPNSGDEVFFEGLKFRYLDKTDLVDFIHPERDFPDISDLRPTSIASV